MERWLADASFLSKADRIRRMDWLPLPMSVKISMIAKRLNNIVTGTAILTDFDKNTYAMIPAIRQTMPVRVPDGNMAQIQAIPVMRKNNLCFLILLVIPKIRKATAVEAIPIPKLAASL